MNKPKYQNTTFSINNWTQNLSLSFKGAILLLVFSFGTTIANAAFPTVESIGSNNSGGSVTESAITLPSGVTSGDLLLVFFTLDGTSVPSSVTGSGWAQVGSHISQGHYFTVYWKIADGNDSLSFSHSREGSAHVSYRITGHDPLTAPEASFVNGDFDEPNPPSLNPTNWGVEDTLWTAVISWDRDQLILSYPPNYTSNQVLSEWNNANGTGMVVATYNNAVETEDPGAGDQSWAQVWTTATIGVRPEQVAAENTLSGTLYTDKGVTTAGSGKTIKIAVGTSTPSVHSVTTDASGEWGLSDIDDTNLSTTTPITIWLDGDENNATTIVSGYNSSLFSDIPLYYDYTMAYASTSNTTIDLSDFNFYDSTSDDDILYTVNDSDFTISSNFLINQGNFVAPTTTMNVVGDFENNSSFDANSGEVDLKYRIGDYLAGRDSMGGTGSNSANNILAFAGSGNYIYVGMTGDSTTCSQVAGSADGCELKVFDISSSTNPVYVAGRDGDGSADGSTIETIYAMDISGDYLYVGKGANTTACSQTAGSADGCELIVFDISSSTNPVYVAGRDRSGSSNGTGGVLIYTLVASENYLYVGGESNTTACSQIAGSAIGCEMTVYDIASGTNPVYVAGQDVSGSNTGTGGRWINTLSISGDHIYAGKEGDDSGACSQSAGSAIGCELMVFDISSSTDPIYVAGRDSNGSASGSGWVWIDSLTVKDDTLYVGKGTDSRACSQTAGSADGCEVMVFDISTPTSPTYVAGRDVKGDASGTGSQTVYELITSGDSLYIAKGSNSTACSQTAGSAQGCELMVFDISSSTNPTYVSGIDASGSKTGTGWVTMWTVYKHEGLLFIGKHGNATACSQTAGSAEGCEMMSFDIGANLSGSMIGSNAFNNLKISNHATLDANASTSALMIGSDSHLVAPTNLTVAGSYMNNNVFEANEGTLTIQNSKSDIMSYLAGMSGDGSSSGALFEYIETIAVSGNYLFAGQTNNSIACSQTAGSADGCEILVFDISDPSNPVYVAGRDVDGSSSGTGNVIIKNLTVDGNYLFVAKAGDATACSQTAGSANGCEIMIFDISSSTNPIYVAGRDTDGSTSGTKSLSVQTLSVANNMLYAGKAANSVACSQTAGSADGCEIMVFDISSSTNPVYVAGRDSSASSNGSIANAVYSSVVDNDHLYIGKTGGVSSCSQTAGSASNCALLVFDVSSSTNPVYVAGRDVNGGSTGSGAENILALKVVDEHLYIGKTGNTTACSQTAGSAVGCELMVFDISSPTNPTYVAGRDVDGSSSGTSDVNINTIDHKDYNLYLGKESNSTACSQTAGSAVGCELMVFNISSPSDPTYVAGQDSDGSASGTGANSFNSVIAKDDSVYVGKNAGFSACSQTAGSAVNCGLMIFDNASAGILFGDMIDSNSLANLTIDGFAKFIDNASTTDLVIKTGSTAIAPNKLTVAGDINNSGSFNANDGEVILSGSNQNLISSATTTFYSLTKEVSVADTLTFTASSTYVTTGVLTLSGAPNNLLSLRSSVPGTEWFLDPQASSSLEYLDVKDSNNINVTTVICSVGCIDSGNNTNWNIVAGTSLVSSDNYSFYVGQASTTLDQITITKSAGETNILTANDLRISIATTTTDFRFSTDVTSLTFGGNASGKVSNTVSYEDSGATLVIDVTDDFALDDVLTIDGIEVGSFASVSTTTSKFKLYVDGSIVGDPLVQDTKTIVITGNIGLGEHTLGQVNNQFSFQNRTDEALFAFKLDPSGENASVTDIVFTLVGANGIDSGEVSSLRLYRDVDSDKTLSDGDELLDNAGILTLNGQNGAITFSSDFTSSTTNDYLIIANTSVIDRGDAMVITLPVSGVTAVGAVSNSSSIITGSVEDLQHLRNGSGGGGGSNIGRVGGASPAGAGVVSGGGSGGGSEGDAEEEGENIVSNPNFFKADTTGTPHNEWTDPANAYNSDGAYATAATNGLRQSYSGFDFNIPSSNTIQGIEVKLDASGSTAAGTIDVSLSWDGGNSYTTGKATSALSSSDIVYTVGGNSDVWGHSWVPSEFSSSNFLIRVTAAPSDNTLKLDALEIKVHHKAGGGGSGGGGGI